MDRLNQKSLTLLSLGFALVLLSAVSSEGRIKPKTGECDCQRVMVRDLSGNEINLWTHPAGNDCDHDHLTNKEEDKDGDCIVDEKESNWKKEGGLDTDGDHISDFYEIYKDEGRTQCRCGSKKNGKCSEDCNGDETPNFRDDDSDGDDIPDIEENCDYSSVDNDTAALLPAGTSSTKCLDAAANPQKYARSPYNWQETDPYNADTDGDKIRDGEDFCPRAAGGKRDEFQQTADVACAQKKATGGVDLCLRDIISRVDPTWDSDLDGRFDVNEEAENKDCQYFASRTSRESKLFVRDTDGDGKVDGVDECPQDGDLACEAICISGNQAYNAITETIADRATLDTDGDNLKDSVEDANGNCEWDPPTSVGGRDVPGETDWQNADTDCNTAAGCDGFRDDFDACGTSSDAAWRNFDTDGDDLKNGEEDVDGDCIKDPFESDPFDDDSDDDGTLDKSDTCPLDASSTCLVRQCIPANIKMDKDSDGDGLMDAEEDSNTNCLYFGITTQNGGGVEQPEPFDTNPFHPDSDGDKIPDRVDGCQQRDPAFPGSVSLPVTDEEISCARSQCLEFGFGRSVGANKDSDRDLIPDMKEDLDHDCELTTGAAGETQETDRFDPDTDDDGIPDGVEDRNRNGQVDKGETDPRRDDSDLDGISDGVEDRDHDGRQDFGESDPTKTDTDGDTIPDNIEDRDLNGSWDGGQATSVGPCVPGGNPETSAYLKDSDLDGILDNVEDKNMNGVFTDIGGFFSTVVDGEEVPPVIEADISTTTEFGESHPCDSDTDGDGLFDGQEDLNKNGTLDIKEGETSPISPSTFGEPDASRLERRLGIGGCTLIPE